MSGPPPVGPDAGDPILAKRARITTLVKRGKRIGYGLFAYAVVGFVVGAVVGFSGPLVDTIVAALAIGSILLIPAIVFGYGVGAAIREERQQAAARADHGPKSGR